MFTQPVSDLIRQRRSCRTFSAAAINSGQWQQIRGYFETISVPFANHVRLDVVDGEQVKSDNFFSTGTYGMIKGARFYIAGIIAKHADRGWEDAGFALEAATLKCTDLGLGACWIGGVFDRKRFGRQLGLRPDEILPAVVAVGHAAEKASFRDLIVRRGAHGDQRKPPGQLFFKGSLSLPLNYSEWPEFREVLENVRLAPSASNKQPWRIIVNGSRFHFFLDRDRAYRRLMPAADLQRMDMGIAMCHFQLSAREAGWKGKWQMNQPAIPVIPDNFEYIVSYQRTSQPSPGGKVSSSRRGDPRH